jgi:hypothetical protein
MTKMADGTRDRSFEVLTGPRSSAALFSYIGADRPDFVWFHDSMAGEPRDLYAQVVETALDRINNDCRKPKDSKAS